MFAILINEDNLPKILDRITPTEDGHPSFDIYLRSENPWFAVTGYVRETDGKVIDWAIIPGFVISTDYEHDRTKIKTDWDQIVRKH